MTHPARALEFDLEEILKSRTRLSSSGFPYLHRSVWARLRDWVPLLLRDGQPVLDATTLLVEKLGPSATPNAQVVRQVVNTAAITAPADLWLMRHVQAAMAQAGLAQRLLNDETVFADAVGLLSTEIDIDLRFLLSRGTLVRQGRGYRLADHAAARTFMAMSAVPPTPDASTLWAAALSGSAPSAPLHRDRDAAGEAHPHAKERGIWHPSAHEVALGAELLPLVVGLKASHRIDAILEAGRIGQLVEDRAMNQVALDILSDAHVIDASGALTETGRRTLARGPGPYGIIEAYRAYLTALPEIWAKGRGHVWVERTANVTASQAANQKSFKRAHNALDAFCAASGFTYDVFIEHAVGKGEAIRQRAERTPDGLTFIGADLEDAAIDAAEKERDAGALPAATHFVRHADIGKPETLLDGMKALGVEANGAVMMVGNGFHEVRGKTDAGMVDVFKGYAAAGLVLIFTEETALAVDDLLETAFNTYHAGFRYVHERSGQSLRPANHAPPSSLEPDRPLSWSECAEAAGYRRADRFCKKSRTVYPYTPPSGFNPSISVDHFFLPPRVAPLLND